MPNPNKAKGTAWETALVRYLTDRTALPLRRVAQTGRLDTGDLHGIPDWTIQAKAVATYGRAAIEGWSDDTRRQAQAAGVPYGALIIKRARKPTGDALVVLRLDDFAEIIRRLYSSPVHGW